LLWLDELIRLGIWLLLLFTKLLLLLLVCELLIGDVIDSGVVILLELSVLISVVDLELVAAVLSRDVELEDLCTAAIAEWTSAAAIGGGMGRGRGESGEEA